MLINHKIAAVLIGAALLPMATWLPTGLLPSASAGSVTLKMGVSATVPANCNFNNSTPALSFGSYDPTGLQATSALTASASFTIRCTKNTTATMTIDNGVNASNSQRRMTDGAGDYLNYQLYSDPAYTTVWDLTNTVSYTSTSAATAQTETVYGSVPAAQDVAVGNYSDTVTITAAY